MRLEKLQDYLNEHGLTYKYWEENDSGSIEFEYRGLRYHIWEYPEPERGAESNILMAGRSQEYNDADYEDQLLAILKTWNL